MTVSRIKLSPDGPEVSRIAWGTMRLDRDVDSRNPQDLLRKIEECLEVGVTTLDAADIYGDYRCEALLGAALAQDPGLRRRVELVSKCGIMLRSPARPHHRVKHYNTGYDHIVASAENSLRLLNTDRLDLLLIHRPDPLMDAGEVAEALHRLHREGKILHYGVSNFLPHQFDLLQSRLERPLVTNQVPLSVLYPDHLDDGVLDQCQRLRIHPMAWSPLGGAALFDSDDERVRRVRDALGQVAGETGAAGIDQVALAWVLRHPSGPVPVLGTNRINRIRTLAGAEGLRLDRQQWFAIRQAIMGREVP